VCNRNLNYNEKSSDDEDESRKRRREDSEEEDDDKESDSGREEEGEDERGSGSDDAFDDLSEEEREEIGLRRLPKVTVSPGSRKQKPRGAVPPNPNNRERTIPTDPLKGESKYKFSKRVLLWYQRLHGDMLVIRSFIVQWTNEWPEKCGV
jgi:hypothetical protein